MRSAGRVFPWLVLDDGSLLARERAVLDRVLGSHTKWVSCSEAEDALNRSLPVSRFRTLRSRRLIYPNLRKLMDVHVLGDGAKLVLDSDMLFFRRPDALLSWLEAPAFPLAMCDCEESYGHARDWLAALAGTELPERVNVGICGVNSSDIEWPRVEYWLQRLEQGGPSYYDEQALVALILAGRPHTILPTQYLCLPGVDEIRHPSAVLHHYVAEAKRGYFREAWKTALDRHSGFTTTRSTSSAPVVN